jgi:ABC-type uncharacterized transport system involved in gliding motility auxiliary subunit
MQRILNVLSYVGMALVFGALILRWGGATALGLGPEWDRYAVYAALTGLVLVLLYVLGQWREIAEWFKGRNARYGAMTGLSVLVVLGILIAVNYVSFRQNKRWDLTANQQYSLSDQTVKLLQNLDAPVRFLVFDQETGFDRFRTRLTEYEYQSDNVEVEYVDADRRPVQAKEYEIQQYGTVVVEYMGRRERVTSDQEQDLTNALIKVLNPVMRKVYFLSGHGEKDPDDSEREGYSGIADALRRDNYEFEKLSLAQTNAIPDDATMVVVAGPQTDLLEQEVTLLSEYLGKRSGKLMAMLDPSESLTQARPLPRLEGLLKEWGIEATQSVVVDVSGLTRIATMPVGAPPYPNHPITDRFELITMFPLARAVTPFTAPQNRSATTFLHTTPRSWAETTLASLEDPETLAPEPDKGDLPGPVSIGVAVAVPAPAPEKTPEEQAADAENPEQQSPEARVVAFGDSDFAMNAYLGVEGNADLFMNTVNWLAQQENLIAVRPRQAADRRLTLTANMTNVIGWLSLAVVPAAVLVVGIMGWWRRR